MCRSVYGIVIVVSGGFSILSNLRGLVGSKTLTRQDVQPMLDKMKDHLIGEWNSAPPSCCHPLSHPA